MSLPQLSLCKLHSEMNTADRKYPCGPERFLIMRLKTTPVTQEVPHSQIF